MALVFTSTFDHTSGFYLWPWDITLLFDDFIKWVNNQKGKK